MPACVGVPLRTPDELRASPGGSVPAVTLQVSGATPPEAASVVEYGVFVLPLGSTAPVVMATSEPVTVIVNALVAVPGVGYALSRTCTVKGNVPVAVHIPLMTPVVLFSTKPEGSAPAMIDHVYCWVPPAALKGWL